MQLRDVIGKPFEYGARGPDSYDCYGLVKHLLRELQGKDVPDYLSPDDRSQIEALVNEKKVFWRETKEKEGAVVLIRVFNGMHVGYCLGYGKFIHVWQRSNGVTIETLRFWKQRIVGFYEYVG